MLQSYHWPNFDKPSYHRIHPQFLGSLPIDHLFCHRVQPRSTHPGTEQHGQSAEYPCAYHMHNIYNSHCAFFSFPNVNSCTAAEPHCKSCIQNTKGFLHITYTTCPTSHTSMCISRLVAPTVSQGSIRSFHRIPSHSLGTL